MSRFEPDMLNAPTPNWFPPLSKLQNSSLLKGQFGVVDFEPRNDSLEVSNFKGNDDHEKCIAVIVYKNLV